MPIITSGRVLTTLLLLLLVATGIVLLVPQTRASALHQLRLSTEEIPPSYTELYFQPAVPLPYRVGPGTLQDLGFIVSHHGSGPADGRAVVLLTNAGHAAEQVGTFVVRGTTTGPQAFHTTFRAPASAGAFTVTVMLVPSKLAVYVHGSSQADAPGATTTTAGAGAGRSGAGAHG